MIIPSKRYRFTTFKIEKQKKFFKTVFLLLLAAGVVVGGVWGLGSLGLRMPSLEQQPAQERVFLDLWEKNDYQQLLAVTQEILAKNAMDGGALIFNGFANFYTAVAQGAAEDKLPLLDSSITMLRRAELLRNLPLRGQVDYVLAKAYYHKGKFYYDLSARYMQNAIAGGYVGEDSYEYLGLAYAGLAKHEESVGYFLKALEQRPSDLLYLTLAQTYYQMENYASAEEYLERCLNRSSDPVLLQKVHSLLGGIYLQRKDFLKAEGQFAKILEYNERSTEALFSLGEIYQALGDAVKARAFWRRTLAVDSNHYGALRRLYK